MQITRDISLQVATDSTATTLLYDNTGQPTPAPITRMSSAQTGLIQLPASGGTIRLGFGGVQQAYGCYVALNADAVLSVDGHDFTMVVGQQGTGFWEYSADAQLSSLILTVPPGVAAQGTFSIWGDPVADTATTAASS